LQTRERTTYSAPELPICARVWLIRPMRGPSPKPESEKKTTQRSYVRLDSAAGAERRWRRAIARRALFEYLENDEIITTNPMIAIPAPPIIEERIPRL
jgi:hypothetical protein